MTHGGNDGTAESWDARKGWEIREFRAHEEGVSAVAFSPDGSWVVTGGLDEYVRIWETATAHTIGQLKIGKGPRSLTQPKSSLAVSRDGRWIVTAKTRDVCLWDAASGKEISQPSS